jgi:hypothetical protein
MGWMKSIKYKDDKSLVDFWISERKKLCEKALNKKKKFLMIILASCFMFSFCLLNVMHYKCYIVCFRYYTIEYKNIYGIWIFYLRFYAKIVNTI